MNLDNHTANERAKMLCARWKFPYTYALGKFMTEHLVNHYLQAHGLPVAIVRPRWAPRPPLARGPPRSGLRRGWAAAVQRRQQRAACCAPGRRRW